MCSPLVADPYFSAQAAITHSPSKLALQIGVLRQAHCDAACLAQLHHIDRCTGWCRLSQDLDGSAHIVASGAGRPAASPSQRRSGIHLDDVAGDRRADVQRRRSRRSQASVNRIKPNGPRECAPDAKQRTARMRKATRPSSKRQICPRRIASQSLSSGAHSRDPLARNDISNPYFAG